MMAIWSFIIIPNYYFLHFMFIPFVTIYIFRHPTELLKGGKDVGILIGNFLLIYFLCLITLQMVGTI